MSNVAVIGAGAMGLAAAYHALKAGHAVTVYEADDRPGGMAAHFDLDGLSIERYYHFVCKADQSTFELMAELGIGDRMVWRPTGMGYFIDGVHYDWGDPIALLRFPRLTLMERLRYGVQMFLATRRSDWRPLEHLTARDWLVSLVGERTYGLLFRRLFDLKFYEHADRISAAWMWTRIKRVGTSRRSVMQEELGHIEGGSQTLITALVDAIRSGGGEIRLATPVQEVDIDRGRVRGVRTDQDTRPYDAVISTVPTPYIRRLMPSLPQDLLARYEAIENIGVACVVLKLRRSVTRHFWLNVVDTRLGIPGLVEFSNLRALPHTIVYVPYYMPPTNPKFAWSSERFIEDAMGCIKVINPQIGDDDLIAGHVGKLSHAQPVCEPGFAAKLPPIQTPIDGLQIADTSFYYPEDRGVSESVRYGKMMAEALP